MIDLYLEYGGGLGDVFTSIYCNNSYNLLADMPEGHKAKIVLICHNVFAFELFTSHPKFNQFEFLNLPFWWPWEGAENRARYGLKTPGEWTVPMGDSREIMFYPSLEDQRVLDEVKGKRYVVVAPTAGTPGRDFPLSMLSNIVNSLNRKGIHVVYVGRNYNRQGGAGDCRKEVESLPICESFTNTFDRLTVPGTAELVRGSVGVVTTHSAICLVGWYMKKPEFLLYPDGWREQHLMQNTIYTFGLFEGKTIEGSFSAYNQECQDEFENLLL